MERIKQKINNRIVGILSHGKSIEQLEEKIYNLAKYDICWVSFNFYQLFDEFILKKINKRCEIILDCANCINKDFEKYIRIPSLQKIIKRNDIAISLWKLIITWELDDILLFKDNLVLLDEYFNTNYVANTLALLIYTIASCNPQKIILFGCDGYTKDDDGLISYYKPELQIYRRILMRGNIEATLDRETKDFNRDFFGIYGSIFKKDYNIPTYNCSINSNITIFPKIIYNEIEEFIYESGC